MSNKFFLRLLEEYAKALVDLACPPDTTTQAGRVALAKKEAKARALLAKVRAKLTEESDREGPSLEERHLTMIQGLKGLAAREDLVVPGKVKDPENSE